MKTSKKFKSNLSGIVLLVFLIAVLAVAFFYYTDQEPTKDNMQTKKLGDKELDFKLNAFFDNVVVGGPPPDGIPPIENPKYVTMDKADNFLNNRDVVFLVQAKEGTFVYPQKILVWHEIVNDEIDGEKVSITYCPLTGSAIGFKGNLSIGETTFGTSGKLLNSNLVMYDRKTNSYFPQLLGMAISGELKGERLEEFPVIFTRWENIKEVYKNAKVLSEGTGYIRNYGLYPYGSYLTKENYYDSGSPFFPVMNKDARFSDKEIVVAGRINQTAFAILKSAVKNKESIEFEINGKKLNAVYDSNLDAVTVFDDKNNLINTFDVMWFAWVAFEPETGLIR